MAFHAERASLLAESSAKSSPNEFLRLCKMVNEQLINEDKTVGTLKITGRLVEVPANGEAIVIGDLHGDLKSLVHILDESNILVKLKKRHDVLLFFLGDYGDRGQHSVEVYYVVLTLKFMFPKQVILMRGNHEGPKDLIASPHDLLTFFENKFGSDGQEIYQQVRTLFNSLYTCVIIKNRYVLLHGGPPSKATTVNDIAFAHKTHPRNTILEEILWNDPWTEKRGSIASPRGAGRLFGEDVTNRFLKLLNVKAVIRGHQSCPEGYKTDHNNKVLTIFSRKGVPYSNSYGAYLHVDLSQKVEKPKDLLNFVHKF